MTNQANTQPSSLVSLEALIERLETALRTFGQHRSRSWAVSVDHDGANILTISSSHVSGKPEFSEQDEQVIRDAAQHLLSFIGAGPLVSFDVAPPAASVVAEDKPADPPPASSAVRPSLITTDDEKADGLLGNTGTGDSTCPPSTSRLSARWQELFWALPPGEMRHKLRSLEIDIGRMLRED